MLQFVVHKFCLAKVQETAQKNLGKARKSGAEGESLKLLSEFICLLFGFTVESDVFESHRAEARCDLL